MPEQTWTCHEGAWVRHPDILGTKGNPCGYGSDAQNRTLKQGLRCIEKSTPAKRPCAPGRSSLASKASKA
eukprot:1140026-Pelagomonas_calceolata.AAC.5